MILLGGLFLLPMFMQSQQTFNGNGNTGFGNAVGQSSLVVTHTPTAVDFTFTKGSGNLSDMIVIYIANGNAGRSAVDATFTDAGDDFRRAVSIAGSGTANFPPGFRATHAIAIKVGAAGQNSPLFSIPSGGPVSNLPFIRHVGNPIANTDASFTFTFDWAQIGLTAADQFSFVATYGNPNDSNNTIMFLSNEGYGGGFPGGNVGTGTVNLSTYFQYPSGLTCRNATTASDGLWSDAATWVNGNVPIACDNVTIAHDVTLNQNATVNALTINNAATFTASDATARTLTVAGGGTLTNNGTFTAAAGTVAFPGSATVAGMTTFNNVTIAGSVSFGMSSTIGASGSLQINAGGSINVSPPAYHPTSTLIYSTNGIYERGREWSELSGVGYPGNVQIGNGGLNTQLQLATTGGSNVPRACAGNLVVNNGSTINLNNMSQALTVEGNYINGGTTELSTAAGGDLDLRGDMNDNGTFTANARAIFFRGVAIQTVNSTTNPLDIDVVRIDKTGGEVILAQNILVDETANPIQFMTATSVLNLNGFTATFGKNGTASAITMDPLSSIKGSATSSLTILGAGAFGTLYFDQTTAGSTNALANLTINRTSTGSVVLGSAVAIAGDFTITEGTVTAPDLITFNGASAQSLAGLAYNDIAFSGSGIKTFTSSASVDSESTVSFSGTGTVDFDGAADNLNFELKSDSDGTAAVSNATGWTLNGSVTVERFIPAKRAWRLLTAPLKGSADNSIFANWQNNGDAVANGTGLLLWHPQGTTAPAASNTGLFLGAQPNIWRYTTAWTAVANTNTTNLFDAASNNGFLVFATGPHASANLTTTAAATTARAKGTLITGNVNTTIVPGTAQFNLVSNPYASALNTTSLIQPGVGKKVWLLDPTVNLGAYATYDGTNWTPTVPAGDDANIQSGQSFFVQDDAATSFEITETDKATESSNTWFARPATTQNTDKIRVLLYKQAGSNWTLADGILAINNAAGNNAVDNVDAAKITNFNESLMFRNGTTNLAMEYRDLPQVGDVQPMRLTSTTAVPYELRVQTENYTNSSLQPYLEDNLAGTRTAIPMDGTALNVPFTGVVSSATNPDNRFSIVYLTTLSIASPALAGVTVFPNPVVSGRLNIHLVSNAAAATYTITNLLGQAVQKGELTDLQNVIDVPGLRTGLYILNVSQEQKSYMTKINVQ